MLAVSYQSSMIIQLESNYSATHGNTPVWGYIEYVSSELHEISVLAEQLAECMGNALSPTKSIKVSGPS
jgi:hypothetical protein